MPKSKDAVVAPSADKAAALFDAYSRFLNKRELSAYLGCHVNSIDNLRAKRVIPFYKIGGSIMFRLGEVERALERYKVREITL